MRSIQTPITFNPTLEKVAYCVIDNAGNVRKGVYPDTATSGCFSDGTTSVNIGNYEHTVGIYGLYDRVNESTGNSANEKRGYLLSDPARRTQTLTFRTKLASNINTYITSRYLPTPITDLNNILKIALEANDHSAAPIKNRAPGNEKPNSNGYYYFTGSDENKLLTLQRL